MNQTWVAAILSCTGCLTSGDSGTLDEDPQIAGGRADDNVSPAAGYLISSLDQCSGSLVNVPGMPASLHNRVVLSAAHCVGVVRSQDPSVRYYFGTGPRQQIHEAGSHQYEVIGMIDHPFYDRASRQGRIIGGFDISVMILKDAVPDSIQAFELSDLASTDWDNVQDVGYGNNSADAQFQRRLVTLQVRGTESDGADIPTKLDHAPAQTFSVYRDPVSSSRGTMCPGDSGSGLVIRNTNRLVGVLSNQPSSPCGEHEPDASNDARNKDYLNRFAIANQQHTWIVQVLNACAAGLKFYPETGYTQCGKLIDGWNNKGGLAVIGLPISSMYWQPNNDGTVSSYLYQWYERNRLEVHPEHAGTIYEWQLGRLGAEIHAPTTVGFSGNRPNCEFIALSGANGNYLCNDSGTTWLDYWHSHGGLEILGAPISGIVHFDDDRDGFHGNAIWFERARLEDHGGNLILGGFLGKEASGFGL